jgi:hypothetical protein
MYKSPNVYFISTLLDSPMTVIIQTMRNENAESQTRERRKVAMNQLLSRGLRQSGTVRNMAVDSGRPASHRNVHRQPSGFSHSLCHVSGSCSACVGVSVEDKVGGTCTPWHGIARQLCDNFQQTADNHNRYFTFIHGVFD